MKSKQTGFTITELLVVIVVIGILSAVTVPKFTKMLENFKVAEAEHMLEAVRNEQEARCELGDGYTADTGKLGTWATDTSKYFNYSLQACGMSASRVGAGYTLEIPYYQDGRVCCEGCDTLNKDYESCSTLKDSLPVTSCPCAAEGVTPPPPPGGGGCTPTAKPDTSCGCKNTGHYSATWNSEDCRWDIDTSTCIDEDTSGCCVKTPEPTNLGCGCNNTGHYSATWNPTDCKWNIGTTCIDEDTSECEGDDGEEEGVCTYQSSEAVLVARIVAGVTGEEWLMGRYSPICPDELNSSSTGETVGDTCYKHIYNPQTGKRELYIEAWTCGATPPAVPKICRQNNHVAYVNFQSGVFCGQRNDVW